jgi:hypothetical protein
MDQINISSWSSSFSPSSNSIIFYLQFTNFAYISKDANGDQVVIDFLLPEKFRAIKTGVVL